MFAISTYQPKFQMVNYRNKSLFLPHNFRKAIQDSKEGTAPPLLGYCMLFPSTAGLRQIAPLGYDFVFIDAEHNAIDIESMTEYIHTINFMSEGRSAAAVRVPGHDHAWVGWALDAGAGVIMFPQVDTAEQARHCVSACTFGAANGGTRSMPPMRLPFGVDMGQGVKDFNQNVAIIVQIESMEGVNNIEEICQIERIDIIWVGSLDLRISMGLPPNFGQGEEPEFVAAVDKVWKTAEKYGKAKGSFCFGPKLENLKWGEMHFCCMASDMMNVMTDVAVLASTRERLQS
ncbi:Phosphoenolpyruvate/pyruvate domain-containing protein [Flagelloscypha sp. PMI_526]|nr:Phosphoenolpyruvate/pyruvate domain-containing protein [Flagelloscypha sp. PMI_526]